MFGIKVSKKLEAAGISGNLLLWFRSYLSDKRQRVVLPGAESAWKFIQAGVPQNSILGPLLFLLILTTLSQLLGQISVFSLMIPTSLY